jgi:two-component system LytT family sensor kinase
MAYVNISLRQIANTLCLEIENSKSNIHKIKDSISGLGLENVRKRLDILYANEFQLTIQDSEATYSSKLVINI